MYIEDFDPSDFMQEVECVYFKLSLALLHLAEQVKSERRKEKDWSEQHHERPQI